MDLSTVIQNAKTEFQFGPIYSYSGFFCPFGDIYFSVVTELLVNCTWRLCKDHMLLLVSTTLIWPHDIFVILKSCNNSQYNYLFKQTKKYFILKSSTLFWKKDIVHGFYDVYH